MQFVSGGQMAAVVFLTLLLLTLIFGHGIITHVCLALSLSEC
ncbi:MAG: hypothetical protein FD146_2227 [Anaerolineaceae bacterium]|nr:MAG: hypothetical protein FD146_2227 [Anaerolineaceae bacterium]